MKTAELSPELLEAYHNDPVVHNAINLWRTGSVSKEKAYEQAMIALSQQKREALASMVRAAEKAQHEIIMARPQLKDATTKAYLAAADYVLQLHLAQRPKTGAIDALKTAYDEFINRAKACCQGISL